MVRCCLLIAFTLFAPYLGVGQQAVSQIKNSYLSVPIHDLEQNSDAVILVESGEISFDFHVDYGFVLNQKVNRKIQILTEEGIDEAALRIVYYTGRNAKEEVEIVSYQIARSIANEVRIIKVQEAENRKIGEDLYSKEIDIEDIQVGDIIEYTYVVKRNNIDDIPTWFFQDNVPKVKSTYTVKIPDNLTYLISTTGDIEVQKTENISTTWRTVSLGEGESFRFKELEMKFSAQNIPSLSHEPFGGNILNSVAAIRFDLIQFQYPNSALVSLPYKEQDVVKEIYKNRKFGNELNQVKFMKKNIIDEAWFSLNIEDRIEKVFQTIQNHMTWNGEYSFVAGEGVKQAFYKKTGNSADINLMLIAALRAVDVKAEPVVMSTRMNGSSPSLFPRFLNQVVVSVQLADKRIFMDASDPNSLVGMLPIEDLNKEGWLLKDNYTVEKVDTTPIKLSVNQENYKLNLGLDGHVVGTLSNIKSGYDSYWFKNQYKNDFVLKARSAIERRSNALFLKNGKLDETQEGVLYLDYDLQQFGFGSVRGNKMTFKPFAYYREAENPFTAEKRDLPIDFVFPSMEEYILELHLPEGYQVNTILKSANFSNRPVGLLLSYVVENIEENVLRFRINFRTSKTVIAKENYDIVKAFYKEFYTILDQEVEIEKK